MECRGAGRSLTIHNGDPRLYIMSLNNQRIQAVPNFFIIFYNVGVRRKRKIYGAFAETKILHLRISFELPAV